MPGGYHIAQHQYRTFSSWQNVLLDSADIDNEQMHMFSRGIFFIRKHFVKFNIQHLERPVNVANVYLRTGNLLKIIQINHLSDN